MTLFRRSNDVEVSISPEFDREYRPEEMPIHTGIIRASIDAAAADARSSPRPTSRSRPRNIPGTRRPKGQFDGDWPSLRSTNRTKRA